MRTSFVLVTELTPRHLDWQAAQQQAEGLAVSLEPRLGLAPRIRLASLPPDHPNRTICLGGSLVRRRSCQCPRGGSRGGVRRDLRRPDHARLRPGPEGAAQRGRRRRSPGLSPDARRVRRCRLRPSPSHPGLFRADLPGARRARICRRSDRGCCCSPAAKATRSGRAQSYQLMRLVFDQLGFARGEVAFLDHARPLLEEQLERCAREALGWAHRPADDVAQRTLRGRSAAGSMRSVASRPEAQAGPS